MKLFSIMWNGNLSVLAEAAAQIPNLTTALYSSKRVEEQPELRDELLREMKSADLILLYRSTESFWLDLEGEIREIGTRIPVVCIGSDPSNWGLSTVEIPVVAKTYDYCINNGTTNFINLIHWIQYSALGTGECPPEPEYVPWEGIWHPDAKDSYYSDTEQFLNQYEHRNRPLAGILFYRQSWVSGSLDVETAVIRELESRGIGVIPVFSYAVKHENLGNMGSADAVRHFFMDEFEAGRIDLFIKMQSFFLASNKAAGTSDGTIASEGVKLLKQLNVPVVAPVLAYGRTVEEWENDHEGIKSGSVSWSIALPEFEGVIMPMIIGTEEKTTDSRTGAEIPVRTAIKERCSTLAERCMRWMRLRRTALADRKVVFVLNNNPCASVEATVGGGAKLDSPESIVRVLRRMKEEGYSVEVPESGEALVQEIMKRKAISEFRWTTADEIVKKGGVVDTVKLDQYQQWFDAFPDSVRNRMIEVWGNPPGEEVNGVPPSMVYNGELLVTGIMLGNAVVMIQPKRGCAGSRCDGQACKILHEPELPPPHQYFAVYKWIEKVFDADVMIHVGTHGSLEFLPGKQTALSQSCLPDLALGSTPLLYIYNSDNPAEGIVAKRRGHAALVNHLQAVMKVGGLYDTYEELDRLVDEFERTKRSDPGRNHIVQHLILASVKKANMEHELVVITGENGDVRKKLGDCTHDETHQIVMNDMVDQIHGILSRIRNTQINDGLHIFGEIPSGERRVQFINAVVRYDSGDENSFRRILADLCGFDFQTLIDNPGAVDQSTYLAHGIILQKLDELGIDLIADVLGVKAERKKLGWIDKLNIFGSKNEDSSEPLSARAKRIFGLWYRDPSRLDRLPKLIERIESLNQKLNDSNEIYALLNAMNGGFIEPGPSGLIMRGREDIMPTGRNLFALDPYRVPTVAAWEVGKQVAERLIKKHCEDTGAYPESVAIYWMANDIMWADGEGMGQIMALIGVKPLWLSNGRVKGFEIIPQSVLGRPRIDVSIRVSGITRDNFYNCIELIDDAIAAVAKLDEPDELNYIAKHARTAVAELGDSVSQEESMREASLRIFAASPGNYRSGTNLAVYASAWQTNQDLAEIFVYHNGYAYGRGVRGEAKHDALARSLKSVDVTFNKTVSDESDLLVCCCYFGTHGGMTAAARELSGHEVKAYYGDTREPGAVEVRTMAEEIRRVVRTKLLNPEWIEGMKNHGYRGAGDISKRIGRVYGWEATTQEVDDVIFDDITRTFLMDKENREFFQEHNPWALEEIGRRLLEAESRGLWNADPEVSQALKEHYLEVESWIEEDMGDVEGEFQGGSVDIITASEVENWDKELSSVRHLFHKKP